MLRTDERFGAGHLIDILIGADTEKMRQHGHADLPTFGVGRDISKQNWQGIFRQMMGHDLARPDPSRHGALCMTQAGLSILKDQQSITLRMDTLKVEKSRPNVKTLVSDEDAPLLSALKAKRRFLAEQADVPAYIVFNDKTLIEMAQKRPRNFDEMAKISGIGSKKLDTYGAAFLEVIAGEVQEMHPSRKKFAGRNEGTVYDQLLEVQADLMRGECGTEKPMSCSASLLAKIAELKPRDAVSMNRILGDRRAERFGSAFLAVIAAH